MQSYTIEFALLTRHTLPGVPATQVAEVLVSIEAQNGTVYHISAETRPE
jgi:hypothetical protein